MSASCYKWAKHTVVNGRHEYALAAMAILLMTFAVACGDDGDGNRSATATATAPAPTATLPPNHTAAPTASATEAPTSTAIPTATPTPLLVSLTGDALPFVGGPDGRIDGAEVWILEQPDRRVTTGADGHFEFHGLEAGSEVTIVMDHPEYYPIQTGTITLGPDGAERVTFQAVTVQIFDAFADFLELVPDESRCQMVTTVTRVGKSIYDPGAHGEAGAVVTLDPPLPADQGPLYFSESVLPDRSLTETTADGGVLFIQAPPGEYVWTATKPGVEFSQVKMKCRAGVLINASPPWGLQAQAD